MKVKSSELNATNNQVYTRSVGTNAAQASFFDALKDSDTEQRYEACENILQQIDALSEELQKAPTPKGVKKYQQLISDFVQEALNQSSELHEETHWDRQGNRKSYLLVRQINKAVEELVDSVMNKEKPQIDLVAKLTQIRGLLVDLYM